MSERMRRVNEAVRQVLLEAVAELKDPRIGMTHNLGGAPRENVSSVAIVGRYE